MATRLALWMEHGFIVLASVSSMKGLDLKAGGIDGALICPCGGWPREVLRWCGPRSWMVQERKNCKQIAFVSWACPALQFRLQPHFSFVVELPDYYQLGMLLIVNAFLKCQAKAYPVEGGLEKAKDPVFGLPMGEASQTSNDFFRWVCYPSTFTNTVVAFRCKFLLWSRALCGLGEKRVSQNTDLNLACLKMVLCGRRRPK